MQTGPTPCPACRVSVVTNIRWLVSKKLSSPSLTRVSHHEGPLVNASKSLSPLQIRQLGLLGEGQDKDVSSMRRPEARVGWRKCQRPVSAKMLDYHLS